MALGSGVEVIAAYKKAVTWWTAVPCNTTGAGIHIENDTFPIGSPELIPDTSLGSPWERGNDLGNIICDGNLVFKARYDSLNALWAMAMGAAAGPTNLTNGAYYHTLTLAPSNAGYFGTYCAYDGVAVREIPSLKITGFVFGGTGGQALDLTFPGMGDDRIIDSAVNTTLAAVTYLAEDPRIIFDDVQIRINAQGGAALANSDSFYAERFEVTLDRPHEAPFVTNLRRTRSQPIANGKPTIRIALTESAYADVSRIVGLRNRTPYKMDITCFGAKIIATSTYYYQLKMDFPAVFWSAVNLPFNGPARIIPDLTMVAELPTVAAPAGMNTVLPMQLGLWNATGAPPLA
jgi:hypothetical protein